MPEYVWVARWLKKEDNQEEVKQAAESVRKHWREVAKDTGFDPDKAVTVAEGEKEIRVGIAEDMDMQFREGPGSWRFY
jgi:hypothetical protein